MARRSHLPVLREAPPPPTPADVLYVAPTGDGAGRKCGNCSFWVQWPPTCALHDRRLPVISIQTCGYHVYGDPIENPDALVVRQPLDPATSGLIVGPFHGTSCGTCRFFDRQHSLCFGVAGEVHRDGSWTPAQVDPDGCCSRWTR